MLIARTPYVPSPAIRSAARHPPFHSYAVFMSLTHYSMLAYTTLNYLPAFTHNFSPSVTNSTPPTWSVRSTGMPNMA
jgi:hypothetical protein